MTVQLHVFKPCSGVRIASKLFICAGVGVGLEREEEDNVARLIACLQTRLLSHDAPLSIMYLSKPIALKVLLVTKKICSSQQGQDRCCLWTASGESMQLIRCMASCVRKGDICFPVVVYIRASSQESVVVVVKENRKW
jgi:hypothetical protein